MPNWSEEPIFPRLRALVGPDVKRYCRDSGLGGRLQVLVGREPPGWHLSLAHVMVDGDGHPSPGRLPTYAELKEARYLFVPNDVVMAQLFPPTEEFVNIHETTLHLWEVPGGTGM
jgi:hypothetical protein